MNCVEDLQSSRQLSRQSGRSWAARATIGAIVGASLLTMTLPANAEALPESFADLAAEVTPAVVNISAKHTAEVAERQMLPGLPFDIPEGSPFEEFFRQFQDQFRNRQGPGGSPNLPDRIALGSGFIIDADGYVVTNNHVIDDASEIKVTLTSGEEYPADLVGTDPQTDLALLKIEAPKPLPFVEFGDSSEIRVGDWVLAVGNPFGLGGTVTAGIVSAHGRNINAGPYDDFLQIDAAINQGNSGGPSFNRKGEVIGINTAIASPSGGSVGIGFAVPSNLAKPVIAQLRERGSVERGWLGVQIQPVTPEIAAAVGLEDAEGALVASVQPGSPAAEAGLQQGDVIVRYNGKDVKEMRELPWLVASTPVGEEATLTIWRDGDERRIDVAIGLLQPQQQVAAREATPDDAAGQSSEALGAELASLTPELKQRYGIAEDVEGVVIVDVKRDSPAAEQGLRPGDVIQKVGQAAVATPADVESAVRSATKDAVLLLINRNGNAQFVAVDLGTA